MAPVGSGGYSCTGQSRRGSQWIVIIVVAYTIIDTVRGMIDDLRHGRVGVDLLAVVAIAATVAVQEYWAS